MALRLTPHRGAGGDPNPAGCLMRGRVVEFDEHVGLGVVEGEDGRRYPFHCTHIADGSRTIPVATYVEFEVVPHLGRWEATAVRRT